MMIKDKQIGLIYRIKGQTKTHFIAVDKMGETVLINKSQAVILKMR